MEWCKHIHDWGDAWYFVSTYNPFAVRKLPGVDKPDRAFMLEDWQCCPICLTKAPDLEVNESNNKEF